MFQETVLSLESGGITEMRHVRCEDCMKDKQPGTRMIYPASDIGEPAEFERVLLGIARTPEAGQRWMSVNGERKPLPLQHFDCDGCGKPILPGETCGTWTVWTSDQGGIVPWEHEYLERAA